MKEVNTRTTLILWDVTLLTGIMLVVFWNAPQHYNIIVGFITAMALLTCIRNHIAAYKLNGKIY